MASLRHSFNTPSSLRWDQPGSATPPPQRPGSVPFLWEEIPGKPKEPVSLFNPFSNTHSDGKGTLSVRSLELPPRLVAKVKAMQHHVNLESPTMVFDGPGLSKPGITRVHFTCHSFSHYRDAKKTVKRPREAWFWPKKKNKSMKLGEELKISTSTLRRNRSLTSSSASQHGSHFWANIRENLKQVVLWRK